VPFTSEVLRVNDGLITVWFDLPVVVLRSGLAERVAGRKEQAVSTGASFAECVRLPRVRRKLRPVCSCATRVNQLCKRRYRRAELSESPRNLIRPWTVQPDGFIALRDVGDLHVEGQTIPELRPKRCRKHIRTSFHEPVISIVLKGNLEKALLPSWEVQVWPNRAKYDLRGGHDSWFRH